MKDIRNNTGNNNGNNNGFEIMGGMNMNYDNKQYDMQQLINIIGNNATTVGQIGMNIQNMGKQIGIVISQVNTLTDDVGSVKSDIETLKLNEEVTTTQQETIIHTANIRICQILGSNEIERQKYYRIFSKKLYSDTRHSAGLGSKISRTKKGDFQRVIDYIEAWTPSCGCAELKAKADRNAEARLIAKMQGYID